MLFCDIKGLDKGEKMDKNLEWFVKADLSKFEDEYVAIAEEKVVFHGIDPETVYLNAKNIYPDKEVILWKVPKGDIFVFFMVNIW